MGGPADKLEQGQAPCFSSPPAGVVDWKDQGSNPGSTPSWLCDSGASAFLSLSLSFLTCIM